MEASGKSTLLAGLCARLSERDVAFVATREPGGTALGTILRSAFLDPALAIDPLAEAFVLGASRAQLLSEVIEPALARGAHVLCDRYTDSTLVYQGYGRGLDHALLQSLVALATSGREPDLTLLVDVPVAVSRERVCARARERDEPVDRLEREDDAFHTRVREGYLALAARATRIVVLDGTAQPSDVLDCAWPLLEEALA